jgi:tyrosyl-tRNA synthetase
VSDILFGSREVQEISNEEIDVLMKNAPGIDVGINAELVSVLVGAELATSKREARTFIESGAVSVNGQKVTDASATIESGWFKNGIALLRRGKKNYSVLVVRD